MMLDSRFSVFQPGQARKRRYVRDVVGAKIRSSSSRVKPESGDTSAMLLALRYNRVRLVKPESGETSAMLLVLRLNHF